MEGALLLTFLLLAVSAAGASTTTPPPSVDQASGQRQTCEGGLGSVVAQLVRDQSTMNAKQQVMELTLAAAQRELEATKTQLETTKTQLETIKTKLEVAETKLEVAENRLEATMSTLDNTTSQLQAIRADVNSGSSFVRWGRKTCPNNTALVYVGVAGGKPHDQKGSGTNPLCLTRTPQFDNTSKPPYYGYLYGGEYESIPDHHDHDVPCSVCLAPQSTTIMVPATLTCPPGWTPQYSGHLTAQYKDNFATEYVCLDGSPGDDSSGVRNDNGLVFFYVLTVCGSLPCPPYINDRVVTCVVCSK